MSDRIYADPSTCSHPKGEREYELARPSIEWCRRCGIIVDKERGTMIRDSESLAFTTGQFLSELALHQQSPEEEAHGDVEAIVNFFAEVIVLAAEQLGFAFGYGHLTGSDEAENRMAYARWMLLGEERSWPEELIGGVPPIWYALREAAKRIYGDDLENVRVSSDAK